MSWERQKRVVAAVAPFYRIYVFVELRAIVDFVLSWIETCPTDDFFSIEGKMAPPLWKATQELLKKLQIARFREYSVQIVEKVSVLNAYTCTRNTLVQSFKWLSSCWNKIAGFREYFVFLMRKLCTLNSRTNTLTRTRTYAHQAYRRMLSRKHTHALYARDSTCLLKSSCKFLNWAKHLKM